METLINANTPDTLQQTCPWTGTDQDGDVAFVLRYFSFTGVVHLSELLWSESTREFIAFRGRGNPRQLTL